MLGYKGGLAQGPSTKVWRIEGMKLCRSCVPKRLEKPCEQRLSGVQQAMFNLGAYGKTGV